jgi:imidazolonepropionase-like amidohydrolase
MLRSTLIVSCIALCCFMFVLSANSATEKASSVLISNVTVIDIYTGNKTLSDIVIAGDQIVDLKRHGDLTVTKDQRIKNATVIDATGQYAIPGLWDMHVHMTYIPELKHSISHYFIANGVTSVRDMGGVLNEIIAFRENAKRQDVIAPRIWLTGPLLDGSPVVFDGGEFGGHKLSAMGMAVDTPEKAINTVDNLKARGIDLIKTYELLRPEVFVALVKRAHELGLPVMGHIPTRMTIEEAVAAGLDGIAHMKGVDYGCARDPKSIRAERVAIVEKGTKEGMRGIEILSMISKDVEEKAMMQAITRENSPQCQSLIKLLGQQKIWLTATLVQRSLINAIKEDHLSDWYRDLGYMPEFLQQKKQNLLDLMRAENPSQEGEKYYWQFNILKQLHQSGARILIGTDAPTFLFLPGFSVHDELKALVKAGLSPLEALQAGTINGAKFFGVDNAQGSISVGKVADIVLLNADPLSQISNTRKIDTVISRGRVLDRKALDSLLEQAAN